MKKISLYIFVIFASNFIKAQNNNLQFSAALFIGITNTSTASTSDTILTVPANTVWKIESGSTTSSGNNTLELNGSAIHYTGNGTPFSDFPIWLPVGTYHLSLYNGTSGTCTGFISGIQFNLVP